MAIMAINAMEWNMDEQEAMIEAPCLTIWAAGAREVVGFMDHITTAAVEKENDLAGEEKGVCD
jgi:hypothetical protein